MTCHPENEQPIPPEILLAWRVHHDPEYQDRVLATIPPEVNNAMSELVRLALGEAIDALE